MNKTAGGERDRERLGNRARWGRGGGGGRGDQGVKDCRREERLKVGTDK